MCRDFFRGGQLGAPTCDAVAGLCPHLPLGRKRVGVRGMARALPPFQPPQHRDGQRHEYHQRERRRKERRPVVEDAQVREQPADQEEHQPEYRAGEYPEADTALS